MKLYHCMLPTSKTFHSLYIFAGLLMWFKVLRVLLLQEEWGDMTKHASLHAWMCR